MHVITVQKVASRLRSQLLKPKKRHFHTTSLTIIGTVHVFCRLFSRQNLEPFLEFRYELSDELDIEPNNGEPSRQSDTNCHPSVF